MAVVLVKCEDGLLNSITFSDPTIDIYVIDEPDDVLDPEAKPFFKAVPMEIKSEPQILNTIGKISPESTSI